MIVSLTIIKYTTPSESKLGFPERERELVLVNPLLQLTSKLRPPEKKETAGKVTTLADDGLECGRRRRGCSACRRRAGGRACSARERPLLFEEKKTKTRRRGKNSCYGVTALRYMLYFCPTNRAHAASVTLCNSCNFEVLQLICCNSLHRDRLWSAPSAVRGRPPLAIFIFQVEDPLVSAGLRELPTQARV